jgi:hypothetical protein
MYADRLAELVQAKISGKELVTPPHAEQPHIISLIDALRMSTMQIQKPQAATPAPALPLPAATAPTKKKVAREAKVTKMAPSAAKKRPAKKESSKRTGYRNRATRLWSRNGKDWTDKFAAVVPNTFTLEAESCPSGWSSLQVDVEIPAASVAARVRKSPARSAQPGTHP